MSPAEPCLHDVEIHRLCALCGTDLVLLRSLEGTDSSPQQRLQVSHDSTALSVSPAEAKRLGDAAIAHLLQKKKLVLIVDLDQTVIHTTIDGSIHGWLRASEQRTAREQKKHSVESPRGVAGRVETGESSNEGVNAGESFAEDQSTVKSHHAAIPKIGSSSATALDDVFQFRLEDPEPTYFVKPRPGLRDFFYSLKDKYEMHVYTMGTRSYATAICAVIDPKGLYFGNRILSRDESGSMSYKKLSRLFPTDTSMVVIIDDRADVWNFCPNLIKVKPFSFFNGTGDINGAFLPASSASSSSPSQLIAPDPAMITSVPDISPATRNDVIAAIVPVSEIPVLVAGDKHKLTRPSCEVQAKLPYETDADDELDRICEILSLTHRTFYDAYDYQENIRQNQPNRAIQLEAPDVEVIIPELKAQVLSGFSFVFSGIIPLNTSADRSDIWRISTLFGARCQTSVNSHTTHVIASRFGTAKVEEARKQRDVKIVRPDWLYNTCADWKRHPESLYLLPDAPKDNTAQRAIKVSKADRLDQIPVMLELDKLDDTLELTDEEESDGDSVSDPDECSDESRQADGISNKRRREDGEVIDSTSKKLRSTATKSASSSPNDSDESFLLDLENDLDTG